MAQSYPIWNDVTACIYKSSKSYGVRQEGAVDVKIGTSGSNSFHFVSHKVTHRKHPDGSRTYRFYVDGKIIKTATLNTNNEILITEADNE